MRLLPLTYDDALYVATNMRDWDKREIYATRWNNDPADVAGDCCMAGAFGWVAYDDEPIAVLGAVPLHPGVWGVYMFATDNFAKIAISLTKYVRRVMMPSLTATGAHRAECKSIEGHDTAQRWLEFLGANRESTLSGYGREGEDFHLYAWSN
jgi:hypothetical protein